MHKIAVAILNWNGAELLEKFLPSVVEYSSGEGVVVCVIDNGSTDESKELVKARFPSVNLIALPANYGFADGYNKGLIHISSEYFVLLNSDVEVTPDWLTPIITELDTHAELAACQPKILSYLNRNHFEYAGAAGGYIDKYGFPFCKGRLFNVYEEDTGQYESKAEIFWATGACLAIRSKVYFEAGGLDADFFAHMEEIDLCWRILASGYKIAYVPGSTVYHLGGATLSKTNPHKTFLNFRNNLYLLYKNTPDSRIYYLIFIRLILDGIAGIKFLLGFEFDNFWAVLRAHFAFYTSYSRFRKARRINMQRQVIRNHNTIYKGSIVADFFLRGKKRFLDLHFNP